MQETGQFKNIVKRFFQDIKDTAILAFSLKDTTDVDGTIEKISSGIRIKGVNSWILICGALLASIGLDVNSTAIIIGAMLISPLMSPILAIGLSYGISDHKMLFRAVRNFSLAMMVSLVSSTIYFLLTPMGQLTSEIIARTKPTLLDVFVAIFGGIAGIVAMSRKEISNAIPGVAIATALMPPLCTAGYGIANGEWVIFFGAFYLFFLNASFIALVTFIFVRWQNFPIKQYIDEQKRKTIKIALSIGTIIIIIPSAMIFVNVIKETKLQVNIDRFIDNISTKNYDAIDWEIQELDSSSVMKIFVVGEPIPIERIQILDSIFHTDIMQNVDLQFVQMNVPKEERDRFKTEVMDIVSKNILNQLSKSEDVMEEKETKIDSLNTIIKTMQFNKNIITKIQHTLNIYHKNIENIQFARLADFNLNDSLSQFVNLSTPVALVSFKNRISKRNKAKAINQLNSYLINEFQADTVLVLQTN